MSDQLLIVLITVAGVPLVKSLWGWWASRRKAATPGARQAAQLTNEATRLANEGTELDQLERRIEALGGEVEDERRWRREDAARHASDRRAWDEERRTMRSEIDRLEALVRSNAEEYARRMHEVLGQLDALRRGIA